MRTAAGLFSGIGAIERGLSLAGFETTFLCEIAEAARAVLQFHHPRLTLEADVSKVLKLPAVDVLSAGFPCQDLSQAGTTQGILGPKSGLVDHIFRLLRKVEAPPKWLVLENVPFMLHLGRGEAMSHIVKELRELKYRWAYRVIDARAFGLPQRRRRVIILASQTEDPVPVLLGEDSRWPPEFSATSEAAGFYWTEGNTGLGWTDDGVPTLKSGSTIGIASPPAIWLRRERRIVTPDIRDAERLQGLPADWTLPAEKLGGKAGVRWSLIGNAVSVPVFKWLGERMSNQVIQSPVVEGPIVESGKWPTAACGKKNGTVVSVNVSEFPKVLDYSGLDRFLEYPTSGLSLRAARGFLNRARASRLRFAEGFLDDVAYYVKSLEHAAKSRKTALSAT